MDGITDCAYRLICKDVFEKHGQKEDELMIWTEFMSADGYVHNPFGVNLHIMKTEREKECIAQIFGGNEESLLACALDIQKRYNYAGIELNMGCPSPKIMKCAAGSGMLRDKQKTLSILKNLSEQLTTPLSLKTRIGLSNDDIDEQFDFLIEASKYVRMIGVHGRTYKQSHRGFVDWDFIRRLKKRLPHTVIIGNGGLRSYNDAKVFCTPSNQFYLDNVEYLQKRGATNPYSSTNHIDGVKLDGNMIAQSAIGNPWILTPHTPTIHEKAEIIFNHLNLFISTEIYFKKNLGLFKEKGELIMPTFESLQDIKQNISKHLLSLPVDVRISSPIEFRKFLFNYVSGIPESKSLKKKIPKAKTYDSLVNLLKDFFNK